jgi:NAD(P) transhydrogenase subunit alpha
MELIDPFIFRLSIFVLAIFVGYYVVWSVTPALHTPLMSVTNAISSVIVVGALIAVSVATNPLPRNTIVVVDRNSQASINGQTAAPAEVVSSLRRLEKVGEVETAHFSQVAWTSKLLGFFALILASVNIFGGFLVTQRMLAMYRKKEKPPAPGGAAAGQNK